MTLRYWLLSTIILALLLSMLATGCQGKQGSDRQGVVMVGCSDKRIKVGYQSGFNSGASEGYGEASRGETYSPSLKMNLSGGYRHSSGYWRGFNDGYDYGWKTAQKDGSKPGSDWYSKAVTESKEGGEQHVTAYNLSEDDYQEGYASGYNKGVKEAKAGSGFDTPPDSTVDYYCTGKTERYREGWIAGYKDGYRKNRKADDPDTQDGETYQAETYDQGYDAGYPVGYAAGDEAAKAAEPYYQPDPPVELVDSNCEGHSGADYRPGWVMGYTSGYIKAWKNYFPDQ